MAAVEAVEVAEEVEGSILAVAAVDNIRAAAGNIRAVADSVWVPVEVGHIGGNCQFQQRRRLAPNSRHYLREGLHQRSTAPTVLH